MGEFIKYAAEKYGVKAVGITVSEKQAVLAREMCGGLPVEIRLQDYRDLDEKFDHIVSVGMFEHVGYKNYRTYMETADKCLSDDGLFLLHTIGEGCSKIAMEPWVDKYIFPNSLIPSLKQISVAIEKIFVMEDLHNFGAYYDPTLTAWFNNFNRNWDALKVDSARFYRMWKYYLLKPEDPSAHAVCRFGRWYSLRKGSREDAARSAKKRGNRSNPGNPVRLLLNFRSLLIRHVVCYSIAKYMQIMAGP